MPFKNIFVRAKDRSAASRSKVVKVQRFAGMSRRQVEDSPWEPGQIPGGKPPPTQKPSA